MRKIYLFLALCLVGITSVQKAYAAKEIFAILHNNQMQIAYDEKANYSGVIENWSPENGAKGMTESELEQITSVMITNTMSQARLTSMYWWFAGLKNATYITGLEYLHTENVTDMNSTFYNCKKITSLNVSNFNTSNVMTMRSMFDVCRSLTSLDVSSFNTANVTDMAYMFSYCTSLTSLDVTKFNTANVTNMKDMFYNCSSLTSLDLTSFDVEKVTNMKLMFYNDSELKTIYCNDDWSKHNVTESTEMFVNCTALIGDKGTRYDSDYTDITYARPDLNSKPGYFTRKSIQGIEETPSNSPSRGEKILRDGQVLIVVGDKTYDARGVEVR